MFSPARLTLARLRRKLSKKALAEATGFDQKTIIRYEAGDQIPPKESLAAIANVLGFPEPFFFGGDVDELPISAASFRSMKAMSRRDRYAGLAAASIAFVFDDWIGERFTLPSQDLLDLKEDVNPEAAARALRQKWAIGERPIKHVIQLLEAKGVRVFSLAENTKTLDAFSLWRTGTPYIFLNTLKTAERSRFDAAHELGHLILHKHGGVRGGGMKAEVQANNFASAFLMPRADLLAKLPRVNSLNQLVQAKRFWGVSVAALNYRLHKLQILSDWQYRTFCIQIAQNFGSSEPHSTARETSTVWEKVLGALRSEGITKHNIAQSLALPVSEIENVVFGLSKIQSIDGQGHGGHKSHAKLRVVSS